VKPSSIGEKLLSWYELNRRDLPWRRRPSPYAVWVSEIMLQQTRVETVIPYFQRWIQRFPDVKALAQASQQEVLSAWEGLGYYSRARNLHKAAQIIVDQYGGHLPGDAQALRSLPGIGRYTAGAIASIAFGKDAPALDGNIRRVLARLDNMNEPARSPAGERRLWELAARLLPTGRAGDFNQALMDLGATLCTPQAPDCQRCPLSTDCTAYQLGRQELLPVTARKAAIPHHTVTAAVIQREKQVLITQRPSNGLLGGLWEFPGGKVQPGEDLAACLQREIKEELAVEIRVGKAFGEYRHAYTHFRVTLHAFLCQLCKGSQPKAVQVQDLRWVKAEELANYPMGKIDRQIARRLNESIC
jgi:A/G-specific adenine glycosylase